jgi:hypothetical protein
VTKIASDTSREIKRQNNTKAGASFLADQVSGLLFFLCGIGPPDVPSLRM